MTRSQTIAILSAALLAALIGLAVLLALQALRADEILAQAALAAQHGQMRFSNVMEVMSANTSHTYLSK